MDHVMESYGLRPDTVLELHKIYGKLDYKGNNVADVVEFFDYIGEVRRPHAHPTHIPPTHTPLAQNLIGGVNRGRERRESCRHCAAQNARFASGLR